jgi:IS30 family transposase
LLGYIATDEPPNFDTLKLNFEVQLNKLKLSMQKNKKYKHLTKTDRLEIEALIKKNLKQYEIAESLKVSKSTISREILKRKKETGEYDGFVAEHKARIKRSNSKHCGMKIEKDAFLKSFIEKAL